MKTNQSNAVVTLPYLLGLLESDGSFHILFKADPRMPLNYRIQPEIQWSQKNVQLLHGAQECLHSLGIHSKYKNLPSNQRSGRAPVLKVEGISNCMQFVQLVDIWSEKHVLYPLYGIKALDFMLMKEIFSIVQRGLHNKPEGRCKIIDIEYALHTPPAGLRECTHPFFQKPTPTLR